MRRHHRIKKGRDNFIALCGHISKQQKQLMQYRRRNLTRPFSIIAAFGWAGQIFWQFPHNLQTGGALKTGTGTTRYFNTFFNPAGRGMVLKTDSILDGGSKITFAILPRFITYAAGRPSRSLRYGACAVERETAFVVSISSAAQS